MPYIACTRFNNKTWNENNTWREVNDWSGCIYNCPRKIKPNIPINSEIIILEMNNDINKITGLGLIMNYLKFDSYHSIHSIENYNRYTYKGIYRIDRSDLSEKNIKIMNTFDILLFKGKGHAKRGYGITLIPAHILEYPDFTKLIMQIFKDEHIVI